MPAVLIVTKPPEFNPGGGVVLSQCEPYTGNWRLVLFENGKPEELLTGTYDEVTALQSEWSALAPDDIRRKARDLGSSRPDKFSTTITMPPPVSDTEATQIIDRHRVEQAMLRLESDAKRFTFIPRRTAKGALVAEIHEDMVQGSVDLDALDVGNAREIRGLILDLGPVSTVNPAEIMSFVSLVVGRMGLTGRFVWVAAHEKFRKLVEEAGLDEVIRAYASVEEALAKL